MPVWPKIKNIILLKRVSIVIVIGSFLYGMQLCRHPDILEQYAVYAVIRETFHGEQIGSAFMILAVLKAIALIKNSQTLKVLSRTCLMFVWCLFMVGFMITPPPNTIWIFAFVMVLLIGISTIKPD